MNKILYFDVVEHNSANRRPTRIDADEFHVSGEYVEFFETVGADPPDIEKHSIPGADAGVRLATLPTRRLLTMVHRPREVTPVYEDE